MNLSARQKAHLKGLAHHLKPVVHLGKDGLTVSVLKQIEDALEAHELIKVKVVEGSPLDRHQASDAVPGKVGAFLVQNIGKVLVLYRPHPENPRIALPWPKEEEPRVSTDVRESRRPVARPPGSLLRSVRDGSSVPVPPPRAPRAPREPSEAPRSEERRPAPKPRIAVKMTKVNPKRLSGPKPKRRGMGRKR